MGVDVNGRVAGHDVVSQWDNAAPKLTEHHIWVKFRGSVPRDRVDGHIALRFGELLLELLGRLFALHLAGSMVAVARPTVIASAATLVINADDMR